MPRQSFTATLVQAGIGLLLVALIWELAARAASAPLLFPPLTAVLGELGKLLAGAPFHAHVGATFGVLAAGLVPAVAIGIPIGLALRGGGQRGRLLAPFALILTATPLLVLFPLLTMWLGLGTTPRAVMVFLVSLAAVLHSLMLIRTGATDAPDRDHAASIADGSAIAAGIRAGVVCAAASTVVCELIGSNAGLGYFIMQSFATFETTATLAGTLMVIIPTMIAAVLLHAVELHLAP